MKELLIQIAAYLETRPLGEVLSLYGRVNNVIRTREQQEKENKAVAEKVIQPVKPEVKEAAKPVIKQSIKTPKK